MLSLFQLLAALLTISAIFAWANERIFHLPENIALLIMGIVASLFLIGLELAFPGTKIYGAVIIALRQIDFYDAVINGMLAFLLFAGALHVDFDQLRKRAAPVGLLATLGVLVSTLLVGSGIWAAAALLGLHLDFIWALVFGALIAPTDPVAVLSTLKAVHVPEQLKTDMSGEALFNDGIGVVAFLILVHAALAPRESLDFLNATEMILLEAGGGAILGLVAGIVSYHALRSIDNYSVEVMISLALVTATYALANSIHVSGPIAVVVAGVLIGNHGAAYAMSDKTKRYMFGFWRLIDEILNSMLFLLIGFEVLVAQFQLASAWLGVAAIPLVIVARFLSVGIPVLLLRRWQNFVQGTIPILTWGGIRGGISVALALSLPEGPESALVLSATYCVVLFTVVVQGLSLAAVVRLSTVQKRENGS